MARWASPEERLWSRVDVRGPNECWPLKKPGTGERNHRGYGLIRVEGRRIGTHVYSFYLANGYWPEPFCLHTCDNPPCCNPAHLFAGDAAANANDRDAKGRQPTGAEHGVRVASGWMKRSRHPKHVQGERHPRARLSDREVAAIRKERAAGATTVELGKRYGVTRAHVSRIATGRSRRTHVIKEPIEEDV